MSINPGTGQITGTPTAANSVGTNVTITATDTAFPGESVSTIATIRVGSVIQIAPTTLPAGTIGAPYSSQLTALGGIGGLVFGPPSPASGVLLNSNGLLTIASPQTASISFSVTVHDQASPNEVATANYTVLFASPALNVTFVQQPPNYQEGLPNPTPADLLPTKSKAKPVITPSS